ncbi:MAG TPA: prepilin-type N-terminal cleavage/methylation domain-containing protein [Smithellaceae bacterium]|nr:prepilin-type N-terminal cleavage/methylation domain-containing protein [Smithellaceae bacterium]
MKLNRGFTLIEIIATLTLLAVAAALVVAMGIPAVQSTASSGMVARQYAIVEQMESITSKYREEINDGALDLDSFKKYIEENYDTANAVKTTLASDTYTTREVLLVTLSDAEANQTVVSIFTP